MIRVNLIGSRGRGKGPGGKRPGMQLPTIPNVGILLAILILVAQAAALYMWSDSVKTTADSDDNKIKHLKLELDELNANKAAITELNTEIDKLRSTEGLFQVLFADKRGPVNALSYLSFILLDRNEAETPSEELRSMEAAGWRVAWTAHRAWFNSFRELNGEVTLNGEAMDHEDVAEVQRRLESSPFYRDCRIVFQDKKRDEALGISYVEFSIRASLVYLTDPVVLPGSEAAAAAAAAADADASAGDGGGADGDASGSGDGQGADADPAALAADATGAVPDVYFPRVQVDADSPPADPDAGDPDTGDADSAGAAAENDAAAQGDAKADAGKDARAKATDDDASAAPAPAKEEPVVPKPAEPEAPPRLGAPPKTDDLPPPGRGPLPQAPNGGRPPQADQSGDRPVAE